MSKAGRNDPCPCGSGKKFKRCCLERVEADERAARQEAEREQRKVDREAFEAARARLLEREREEERIFSAVDRLSERVLAHIGDGQLDEAEATARQLIAEFGDEPLGME